MIGNDLEACCRGAGFSAAEAVPRGYRHLSPVDVLEENQDLKTIRNPHPFAATMAGGPSRAMVKAGEGGGLTREERDAVWGLREELELERAKRMESEKELRDLRMILELDNHAAKVARGDKSRRSPVAPAATKSASSYWHASRMASSGLVRDRRSLLASIEPNTSFPPSKTHMTPVAPAKPPDATLRRTGGIPSPYLVPDREYSTSTASAAHRARSRHSRALPSPAHEYAAAQRAAPSELLAAWGNPAASSTRGISPARPKSAATQDRGSVRTLSPSAVIKEATDAVVGSHRRYTSSYHQRDLSPEAGAEYAVATNTGFGAGAAAPGLLVTMGVEAGEGGGPDKSTSPRRLPQQAPPVGAGRVGDHRPFDRNNVYQLDPDSATALLHGGVQFNM
ncbi:hypothetical protein DIPPA_11617 [Diplonema papillatum]|nr:hypothetical protein DIPPA_11617 [Diplonema papillatum]